MIEETTTGASPDPAPKRADDLADENLRPSDLSSYIGQPNVKQQVSILIESAKKRKSFADHILIHGLPGLGKTSLAQVIASELGVGITITSGQAIDKTGDAAALLSNIKKNDVLFIDEIHRLKPKVEEMFYTAMEDFAIDIVLGKGPTARSMRLDVPKFTLVGATTQINKMASPMRDRFGCVLKLDYYSEEEVAEIIGMNAPKLDVDIVDEAVARLACSSRKTPRIANRLLRRVRDYAVVHNEDVATLDLVEKALDALGVDEHGLDPTDLNILNAIHYDFDGGPVGLSTLSAALSEEKESLENVYEPYLMQLGLLQRSQRGRLLTEKGIRFVKLKRADKN